MEHGFLDGVVKRPELKNYLSNAFDLMAANRQDIRRAISAEIVIDAATHRSRQTLRAKIFFEDLNWLITPKERVGIVGANGTGKSTLLKVLAGMEELDYGSVNDEGHPRGLSAAGWHHAQRPHGFRRMPEGIRRNPRARAGSRSRALPHVRTRSCRRRISADRRTLPARRERIHGRDGYNIESRVGAVLTGLGFRREDWPRRGRVFRRLADADRAGETAARRSRICCCSTSRPTISISKRATGWNLISNYPNAFVLISHDRFFLDVTVSRIAEIWNKRVWFYTGGYSKYEQQKAERRAQLEAAYANQRDRIEQLEAFINRFRAQATKAKQVQSRIKELEKIERIEVPPDEKTIHFSFPAAQAQRTRLWRSSENVAKSYGEKHVFSGASFYNRARRPRGAGGRQRRGQVDADQAALGRGAASSPVNTCSGTTSDRLFRAGSVQGARSRVRASSTIWRRSPRDPTIPSCAASSVVFFSEDDVFKRIGVLSGGERNRYALARMLMMPGNFLLLDEPTNHLDMRAKDVLLTALRSLTAPWCLFRTTAISSTSSQPRL